jgi:ubiquinone/menaquinone biosynthesis C-methylase UbiE
MSQVLSASPNLRSWEDAYRRFETPEEEIRKFVRRLKKLGADQWPRDSQIVELFCGRGNGLHALHRLGFTRLQGVDLSADLLAEYNGPAETRLCDCRHLSLEDRSCDIAIVQGGLHHLPKVPEDLDQTLREAHRVLRKDGILMVVEPWQTPFLRLVHRVSRNPVARRLWDKLDALQTMTELEITTYQQWLRQPKAILSCLHKYFRAEQCWSRWGKLMFIGRKI